MKMEIINMDERERSIAAMHERLLTEYENNLEIESASTNHQVPNQNLFFNLCKSVAGSSKSFLQYLCRATTPSFFVPVCWDELVDWTLEATNITAVYMHFSKNPKKIQYRNHPIAFVPMPMENQNCQVPSSTTQPSLLRFFLKEDPLSVEWSERADQFRNSVLIGVIDKTSGQMMGRLSTSQFCSYFALLRRWLECYNLFQRIELESSRKLFMPRRPEEGADACTSPSTDFMETNECYICCDASKDKGYKHSDQRIVLGCCGHDLCGTCQRRWVYLHRSCPFCRRNYESERGIKFMEWEILGNVGDFQKPDKQESLQRDIQQLENKINDILASGLVVVLESCQLTFFEGYRSNLLPPARAMSSLGDESENEDGFVEVNNVPDPSIG